MTVDVPEHEGVPIPRFGGTHARSLVRDIFRAAGVGLMSHNGYLAQTWKARTCVDAGDASGWGTWVVMIQSQCCGLGCGHGDTVAGDITGRR